MIIFMKINIKFIVAEIDYICFVNDKHRYQSVVDFFMYTMLEIRSNIIYVVSVINRYVFNSNESHWKTVKRIFRYFRYFLNFRFTFIDAFQLLKSYIDVDWADNHNIRRSIFDYVFNLRSVVINWFSKRQFIITLSTCETEYMNQIQVVKKTIWLSKLLKELHFNVINKIFVLNAFVYCLIVIVIYCDN